MTTSPPLVPQELRRRHQWVVYRQEARPGAAKPTKVPYVPRADIVKKASVTDPENWGTFEQALVAVKAGGYDGCGYVLTESDGIVFVDLDGCRAPETGDLEPWAAKVVRLLNSYTEVSPSETGLHTLARGILPPNGRRRRGRIEMYSSGRYATITGEHLEGTPTTIEQREDQIAKLYSVVFSEADPASDNHTALERGEHVGIVQGNDHDLALSDEGVLELISSAANRAKFSSLWSGHTSAYQSESEADLALCTMLAFYTQDQMQIERLMRCSGLIRPKWDRQDYIERNIAKAVSGLTERYAGTGGEASTSKETPWQTSAKTLKAQKARCGGLIRQNRLHYLDWLGALLSSLIGILKLTL